MGKHKTPRLNARNWENVADRYGSDMSSVEKLRHHGQTDGDRKLTGKAVKPRQAFHRIDHLDR